MGEAIGRACALMARWRIGWALGLALVLIGVPDIRMAQGTDMDAGYAAEMVRRDMVQRFGEAAYRDGLRVTTTIDGRLQRVAEAAVRDAILAYDRRHGYRGPEVRLPDGAGSAQGGDVDWLDARLARAEPLPGLQAGIVLASAAGRAEVYLGQGAQVSLRLAQMRWARPFLSADRLGPAPRRVDDVVQVGDLIRLRPDRHGGWELAQRPAVSAALLALDPRDGAIRALVGGYRFGADQFNRAVDARRQPGSAFKPFVYAAALADGLSPASLVQDVPVVLKMGGGEVWTPANSDHQALGPIRLRRALTQSRNLAAIDLLDRIGIDYARTFAVRFGFEADRLPRNLTLALGTGDATLSQMAAAYAVFANGGFAIEPYLIGRIEDRVGKVLFKASPPRACEACWFSGDGASTGTSGALADGPEARRVLEPWLVYQMHSMLQDVVRVGTGRRARALRRSDLAGKTGTTNEARDAWFCGYQKDLVTIAWMGFDDSAPLGHGETGGESASSLWMAFMGEALKGQPEAKLPVPAGLVEVRVADADGTPARPGDVGAITEWVRERDLVPLVESDPISIIEDQVMTDTLAPSIVEEVY